MSNSLPPQMQSRSKPVRVLSSVAATSTALVTVLAALVAAGVNMPAWIPVVVGAVGTLIPIAVGEYTKGQVTPWEDVAAKKLPDGTTIAGPAATLATGSPAQVVNEGF